MTKQLTPSGLQKFAPFRALFQAIDEGMKNADCPAIEPGDKLNDPAIIPTIPTQVQVNVDQLVQRVDAYSTTHHDPSLSVLPQAKAAMTRAGGSCKPIRDGKYIVGHVITTPDGHKLVA